MPPEQIGGWFLPLPYCTEISSIADAMNVGPLETSSIFTAVTDQPSRRVQTIKRSISAEGLPGACRACLRGGAIG